MSLGYATEPTRSYERGETVGMRCILTDRVVLTSATKARGSDQIYAPKSDLQRTHLSDRT